MVEVFLVLFIILSIFLAGVLYLTLKDREEIELDLTEANAYNDLLERRLKTLGATNEALRDELRIHRYDPATNQTEVRPLSDFVDEIETEEVPANPQHFAPMYDSQGQVFTTGSAGEVIDFSPKNDYMFFPETYEEETVGYESGNPEERQDSGPESVQDGEEATNGSVRSSTVPGV